MHFCTAKIALAGDIRNEMIRGLYDPVSWPEAELIEFMHGNGSITEISPFVKINQDRRAERERLAILYGNAPVRALWGEKGIGDMETGGVVLQSGVEWFNPITNDLEMTPTREELVQEDPTAPAKKK